MLNGWYNHTLKIIVLCILKMRSVIPSPRSVQGFVAKKTFVEMKGKGAPFRPNIAERIRIYRL